MSLQAMRKSKGMTQKEAASLFGLKHRTYQNYELGVTSPDMDTAAKFARYFECTIGDLFDLEEGIDSTLSNLEKKLLMHFARLNKDGKTALLIVAEDLVKVFKA